MMINTVNLDAMIPRDDIEKVTEVREESEKVREFSLRDFVPGGFITPNLRKPDFQRETNHWTPEQIAIFIESFINGDVIPSVIAWQSSTSANIFIIDGGHRLSALRAWIEDDYGDRQLSARYFGSEIAQAQKKTAEKTRKLVEERVGRFEYWSKLNQDRDKSGLSEKDTRRLRTFSTGTIPVQWVRGNADTAQDSFFKINKQGTPLDETEELLITNRKKAVSICARAIIRAGKGHKYWYDFSPEVKKKIEEKAGLLNKLLFNPEFTTPIKTLDLPLGGTAGVRNALSLLIEFILIANRDQSGKPDKVADIPNDEDGSLTLSTLNNTLELVQRMTGNERGSLGLHPAIYFYSNTGRFAIPLFMGMSTLIAKKLINNDPRFFKKFTKARKQFEQFLIDKRALLATISQQIRSRNRNQMISELYDFIVNIMASGQSPTDEQIIQQSGLKVSVLVPKIESSASKFSDDTKTALFFREALKGVITCFICGGYLDPMKSLSYDHIQRVREGGAGNEKNGQMTHPFCNQGFKS